MMASEEKPKVVRTGVWFDEELWRMAKFVGLVEHKTGAVVVEELLRGPLLKRYQRAKLKHDDMGEAGA